MRWRCGLAYAYERLIGEHHLSGRIEPALAYLDKAIALRKDPIPEELCRFGERWSDGSHKGTLIRLHMHAGFLAQRLKPRVSVRHFQAVLALVETAGESQVSQAGVHHRLGEALANAGDHTGAIEHLRWAASVYQTTLESSDTASTITELVSTLGPLLRELGREAEALQVYRAALAATETYAARLKERGTGLHLAWTLGYVAKQAVYAREFAKALAAAEESMSLLGSVREVAVHRANALMLLGRADEAKAAYLARKGLPDRPNPGDKTWERLVTEGFADLRRAGLDHPLMPEIEKLLGTPGQ
jgi:tetratricopeptide (TPR) repeat protein